MAKKQPAKFKAPPPMSVKDIEGLGMTKLTGETVELPNDYTVSTGSLIMNATLTGDITYGIKSGKISCITGDPSVGKSFICASVIKDATEQGDIDIFILDSENALEDSVLKSLGVKDFKRINRKIVETIGDVRAQIVNICKVVADEGRKGLIILDSWGNLSTQNEIKAAENQKEKYDMGGRNRVQKAASREIFRVTSNANCGMLLTCHSYMEPPSSPMAQPKPVMSSGSGIKYMATNILYMGKRKFYHNKEHIGNYLKMALMKNRLAPENIRNEGVIMFKRGLAKYYGLLEPAKEIGLVKSGGAWYTRVSDDKKVQMKDLYKGPFWEPMLEELRAHLIDEYSFKREDDDEDFLGVENESPEDDSETMPETED